jgi:hypothetical protein
MDMEEIRNIAAKVEADITSRDYYYETLQGVKDMEMAKMAIASELTGVKRLLLELTKSCL